jgi:hypothetical protein
MELVTNCDWSYARPHFRLGKRRCTCASFSFTFRAVSTVFAFDCCTMVIATASAPFMRVKIRGSWLASRTVAICPREMICPFALPTGIAAISAGLLK